MKCPNCQLDAKPGWKICPECNAPLPQQSRCPKCGEAVEGKWRQCPNCETALSPGGGPAISLKDSVVKEVHQTSHQDSRHAGGANIGGSINIHMGQVNQSSSSGEIEYEEFVFTILNAGGDLDTVRTQLNERRRKVGLSIRIAREIEAACEKEVASQTESKSVWPEGEQGGDAEVPLEEEQNSVASEDQETDEPPESELLFVVKLRGIGRLVVTRRAPRVGRNPATGEKIEIPAGISIRSILNWELKRKLRKQLFESSGPVFEAERISRILEGLGRIVAKIRPASVGRNPATGEEVQIPEKVHVYFELDRAIRASFEDATDPLAEIERVLANLPGVLAGTLAYEIDRDVWAEEVGRTCVEVSLPEFLSESIPESGELLTEQKHCAETLGLPVAVKDHLGQEFVLIPEGDFIYGSEEGGTEESREILEPYYMGRYPVMQAHWKRFVQEDGYAWSANSFDSLKPNCPVTNVSWDDAQAYCRWLSRETGLDYRLPSEEEWEKAARGTDGRKYPWGNSEPTSSHAHSNLDEGPIPVGSLPAGRSPYGCHDMSGNVWEWCKDYYNGQNGSRVLRGASWLMFGSRTLLASDRVGDDPGLRYGSFGFRVVLVIESAA